MPWLFGHQGRIRRLQYWAGLGIVLALSIVNVIIVMALGLVDFTSATEAQMSGDALAAFMANLPFMVLGLPITWITIALGVKRFHDRNRSGYWLLPVQLAPYVIGTVSLALGVQNPIVLALYGLSTLVTFAGFIYLGFFPSDPHNNQYGAGPTTLDEARIDAVFGQPDKDQVAFS